MARSSKVKGREIANYEGLKIIVDDQKPKTNRGKRRIVVHIRQNDPERWKVDFTCSWVHATDTRFVEKD